MEECGVPFPDQEEKAVLTGVMPGAEGGNGQRPAFNHALHADFMQLQRGNFRLSELKVQALPDNRTAFLIPINAQGLFVRDMGVTVRGAVAQVRNIQVIRVGMGQAQDFHGGQIQIIAEFVVHTVWCQVQHKALIDEETAAGPVFAPPQSRSVKAGFAAAKQRGDALRSGGS